MSSEPLQSYVEGWALLRRFSSPVRAELLKAVLEEHFIPAIVLNKRDSSYDAFGTVELYVPEDYRANAEEILITEGEVSDEKPLDAHE